MCRGRIGDFRLSRQNGVHPVRVSSVVRPDTFGIWFVYPTHRQTVLRYCRYPYRCSFEDDVLRMTSGAIIGYSQITHGWR
jgi:hypothetical protein